MLLSSKSPTETTNKQQMLLEPNESCNSWEVKLQLFQDSGSCTWQALLLTELIIRASPALNRFMLSGNRLLFPRRCGFASPVSATARGGGVVNGLVPLPRTHLLSSANDGSCFIPVGSEKSQQKLHACDGIQGSLKTLSPHPFLTYPSEYCVNIISDLTGAHTFIYRI